MNKKYSVLAMFLGVFAPALQAINIPFPVKDGVAFIYSPQGATNDVADGTGFFVAVPSSHDTNGIFVYLVTAKHVLQGTNSSWRDEIRVRLNRRDGGVDKIVTPLVTSGPNKSVVTHPDANVDVAAIRWRIPPTAFDYKVMPHSMLATTRDFSTIGITEGSEVFFTGMFVYHMGTKRNMPIMRFGKIALLSDEQVYWRGIEQDLYLIEVNCVGGNSGSPVFFLSDLLYKGTLSSQPSIMKCVGLLIGHFNDGVLVKEVPTGTVSATFPSQGISAVVPADKILDLLMSEEEKAFREQAR